MAGVFWQDRTRETTAAEAKEYLAPEATAERLHGAFRRWIDRALIDLWPAEFTRQIAEIAAVDEGEDVLLLRPRFNRLLDDRKNRLSMAPVPVSVRLGVSLEAPDWIDPRNPHHVINELRRIVWQLPPIVPARWRAATDGDEKAFAALRVLESVRRVVDATHNMDGVQAVLIIERSIDLGVNLARAHVEPWEPDAERGRQAMQKKGEGNRRSAEVRKQQKEHRKREALSLRDQYRANGTLEHNIVGKVARKMYLSKKTVERYFKN